MPPASRRQIEHDVAAVVASSRARPRARPADDDPLAATILPPGSPALGVGRESGRLRRDGISRHADPYGSTRYLRSVSGVIASGLQVMSRDGKEAVIANVYTRPEFRGRGFAAELLSRARRDFSAVHHADEGSLSTSGRGWRDAVR